ncbi:MAG: hypothetical protein QOG35_1787 [Solirubrobacteraceae bacterium]|jgi:uncharacterized protein YkwD|nr:hypothetical protein [Solirubrobacteraceae bacterium]
MSPRRTTLFAAAAVAVLAAAPAAAQGVPRPLTTADGLTPAQACPGADSLVTAATATQLDDVVLCLINRERAARAMRALRPSSLLDDAASRYARQMVAQRFFDHVSPSGLSLRTRVARAGYLRGNFLIGEDIATGTGQDASPAGIVEAWMSSPPHRRNILEPAFRDAGLGIAPGLATGSAPDGATYVVDFGRRS